MLMGKPDLILTLSGGSSIPMSELMSKLRGLFEEFKDVKIVPLPEEQEDYDGETCSETALIRYQKDSTKEVCILNDSNLIITISGGSSMPLNDLMDKIKSLLLSEEFMAVQTNYVPDGDTGYDGFTSDETVLIRFQSNSLGKIRSQSGIYDEIKTEREIQDTKWGGKEHDDQHTNFDWIVFITKHVGKAVTWPFDPSKFRTQMIKVAALAVAAIEWIDRKTQ